MTESPLPTETNPKTSTWIKPARTALGRRPLANTILFLLLLVILLAGLYFRLEGTYWGEYTYMHPDERFLLWVGADISPVKMMAEPAAASNTETGIAFGDVKRQWISLSEYFDTANSPLNPHNRGHGFYVYGTLPMFVTRIVVEWIYGHSGFAEMLNVGRPLSALADLLTVLLVFLVGTRLYDRRVGLLAAAFSAAVVLQIQQSHFFTMDTFINLFSFLAFFFAVQVAVGKNHRAGNNHQVVTNDQSSSTHQEGNDPQDEDIAGGELLPGTDHLQAPAKPGSLGMLKDFFTQPEFWLCLFFGVALGMAVASKLNAAPMALTLPAAMLVRWFKRPAGDRSSRQWLLRWLAYLALAALVSLVTFRIGQPYAFSGPGFFGLKPNPLWVENIQSLSAQTGGDVDFPPALQWARRPLWFSGKNMLLWGLGLPLGILAWTGFLAAGWRILKGDWQRHGLIWGWTALYFTWQSLAFNPTMRYQLPVYPTLVIFAAWFIVYLHDHKPLAKLAAARKRLPAWSSLTWNRILAILVGAIVLVGTYAWAYAFTRIYARPFTRVEGSRWIYQNIPGPLNLHIQTDQGLLNQPLPVPYNTLVRNEIPYSTSFTANASGQLSEIYLAHVLEGDRSNMRGELSLVISSLPSRAAPLGSGKLEARPGSQEPAAQEANNKQSTFPEEGYLVEIQPAVPVLRDVDYYLNMNDSTGARSWDLCGGMIVYIQTGSSLLLKDIPAPQDCNMTPGVLLSIPFTAPDGGNIVEVYFSRAEPLDFQPAPKTITVELAPAGQAEPAAFASLTADFPDQPQLGAQLPTSSIANGYRMGLQPAMTLEKGKTYSLTVRLVEGSGYVTILGSAIANEGDWDDGLPLRIDGYDGFGGMYIPDLNFNMYWDDNSEKLARFNRILDEAEYIVITSNRQWGTLPRLPERFPMSSLYYRSLLGCPPERSIEWCYSVATPGMFQGGMGFDLVKTIQSDPSLDAFLPSLDLKVNTQFAEEAFTVYDHPKVLIFQKRPDYDPLNVRAILGTVDFSQVIHLTPKRAGAYPADLMLPADRLSEQRRGGTWSDYFNPNALHNKFQPLGVLLWYLAVSLLGWVTYPILRAALPGLPDKGYPLARTTGMLLLSYLVWLAGSNRIPFTRPTIAAALALITLLGIWLGYRQRQALRQEWLERRGYFLTLEGISLVFFLAFLLVRLGNGDLWHPYFGGEKPMDFSYFNAVLKSTSFPPYDPWYAGGYLNYYYYGFVFSGVLVKFLGIMPSFAYNLVLPTMFSLAALGAFSGAFNLVSHANPFRSKSSVEVQPAAPASPSPGRRSPSLPYWAGLAAALLMVVLGNLGTLRMIFRGYVNLGLEGKTLNGQPLSYDEASLPQIWSSAFEGVGKVVSGDSLHYGIGDWYWIPTRLMPPGDNAITEFPAFTFLYADPHAHLFAMPIALLCLGWVIAVVLGKARWSSPGAALLSLFLGGLAIGAMGPTNTWDYFAYLPLGLVALAYALLRYYHPGSQSVPQPDPGQPAPTTRVSLLRPFAALPAAAQRFLVILGSLALLTGLTQVLFLPYQHWFGQAYSSIEAWKGPLTPFSAYITHWGLFLFILLSWTLWEVYDWMATTPVSALHKLDPYWELIWFSLASLLILALAIVLKIPSETDANTLLAKLPFGRGVGLAGVILPAAALAGVLLLRPGKPGDASTGDPRRIVLFMLGTGLVITLFVELYVLRGDIGRQNTVFKLYLQVWTMFSVCAGAALVWLINSFNKWKNGWYYTWVSGFSILFFSAALFTLLGTSAKIRDRMVVDAPHSLDGMNYMRYASYAWLDSTMDLSQDYRAIRWAQDHIQGSPVIVEANSRDLYRWYLRFTIYTGLPSVVGWEWHQQQQRGVVPGEWVSKRVHEIDEFYRSTDLELALGFLHRYNVGYIVLGQLERITYPGEGLLKFKEYEGQLWKTVYQDEQTVIYEVIGGTGSGQ